LTWSANGEFVFSGDKQGVVVLTKINYEKNQTESILALQEANEIVQLSYLKKKLAVSTTVRTVLCEVDQKKEKFEVQQVGAKERKRYVNLGYIYRLIVDRR
jgi:hypothetical protein